MKKRFRTARIAGILSCALLINCFGMNAQATGVVQIPSTELESVYQMQVQSNTWEDWTNGPQIYSESGIVMDIDSGNILYAKNIDDKHYPASITKIMTALVALQNYDMSETVSFTWDDIGFLEYGDAHIGIKPDEQVNMLDCMYAMLFASANEVSHAIGAHYEGGYEAFLAEMNRVSAEIGCTNSHWMNTHGLHDPEHYTSVHDMAIIGSELFQYDLFREIESKQSHEIPETAMTNEKRYAWQNHKMVYSNHRHYYEYCVGGKTGFTDQALTTLVTFATKDDMNLVAVVMRTHGGGNNAYLDTRNMLDYAFDNFEKATLNIEVVDEKGSMFGSAITTDIAVPVGQSGNVTYTVAAPTELEDRTADITISYGTRELLSFEENITEEYYNEIHGIKPPKAEDEDQEKKGLPGIVKVLLVIVGLVFGAFAVLFVYVYYKRKQMEKRRKLRRLQRMRQMEERGY